MAQACACGFHLKRRSSHLKMAVADIMIGNGNVAQIELNWVTNWPIKSGID